MVLPREAQIEKWQYGVKRKRGANTKKVVESAAKIMSTVFDHFIKVFLIDYLPHGKTIRVPRYCEMWQRMAGTKKKTKGKFTKVVFVLQDNFRWSYSIPTWVDSIGSVSFRDLVVSTFRSNPLGKYAWQTRTICHKKLKYCLPEWWQNVMSHDWKNVYHATKDLLKTNTCKNKFYVHFKIYFLNNCFLFLY